MKVEKLSLLSKPARPITTIVSLMAMVQVSQAALYVNVTGDATGSGSTWVFSGTSLVTLNSDDELKDYDAEKNVNHYFHSTGDLSGDYVEQSVYSSKSLVGFTIAQGTVAGSSSGAFEFDGLILDGDDLNGADDFAWLLGDQDPHTFVAGETITYTNYTLVTDIDITKFGVGSTKIVNNGDTFSISSSSEPMGDLTMTFTAVPEPSSTMLLGLGALALVTRRQRSK